MNKKLVTGLATAVFVLGCDGPTPTDAVMESAEMGAIVADLTPGADCPAPYACRAGGSEDGDLLARVSAMATDWTRGDVFAGVSQGSYNVYGATGVFKETISGGAGFTTGCAFDRAVEKLYTTDFSGGQLLVYDEDSPHTVLQTIPTGPSPESVVFDSNGDFYVGTVGGQRDVEKYDAAGNFLTRYDVATENVGADWIELAADETTLFYTSEGTRVFRYDLSTSSQLPDFASLPSTRMFALRLLPPGDGSGGLLVASTTNVVRLDGSGNVVATYDVSGIDFFFALNLDPDGSSFWSGDVVTGQFFKFDINTPGLDQQLLTVSTGATGLLFGLCVQGELTGGNTPPTAMINDPSNGDMFTQGQPINFDGEGDDAEDGALSGSALQWTSDLDGSIGSGATFSSSTLSLGTHVITLTVTDSDGAVATASVSIQVMAGQVNTPPTALINSPSDGDMFMPGQSIAFDGEGDDAEDGALTGASLEWTSSRDGVIGTGETFSATLSVGTHTITLTAMDSDGATGTATVDVTVKAPSTGKDLVNKLEDIWYELRDLNQAGTIDDAQFSTLERTIRRAIAAAIDSPFDRVGVIKAIEDFAKEVRALGSAGVLSSAEVQMLVGMARDALRSLP